MADRVRLAFPANGLVRALTVELPAEAVEAALLGAAGGCRRARRFGLQCPMHPFMAAILLGLARFDQLRPDAEADEPSGEC